MLMPTRTVAPASAEPPATPRDVRDMLMYRMTRLVTIGERAGQARISRQFGINVGEWRVLGAIHALAPVTLAGLADELYLDKGQLSRTVSALIDSGFVSHRANADDRRQALYETTATGRRLHDQLLAFVAVRNSRLMSVLSVREQAMLFKLMDKLAVTFVQSHDEVFGASAPAAARKAAAAASLATPKRIRISGSRARSRAAGA